MRDAWYTWPGSALRMQRNAPALTPSHFSPRSDGSVFAAGGEMPGADYVEAPAPWLAEGRFALRVFNASTLTWQVLPDALQFAHWYPTQVGAWEGGGGGGMKWRITVGIEYCCPTHWWQLMVSWIG